MTERPIIFSAAMVRAILDRRKTQTRRVVKPQPQALYRLTDDKLHCPFQIGRSLWIRETWAPSYDCDHFNHLHDKEILFKADGHTCPSRWHPSIFMPRWASRITLEVTGVRVERLQDITGGGVLAEGVDNGKSNFAMGVRWENMQRMAFAEAWDSINAKQGYGWAVNPWVWVIEFKMTDGAS